MKIKGRTGIDNGSGTSDSNTKTEKTTLILISVYQMMLKHIVYKFLRNCYRKRKYSGIV